jgi:hypothetical protein
MLRRPHASTLSLSVLTALAVAGFSPAALAHIADHSHMTVVEVAEHLLTSLDHRLTIMAALILLAAAGASALLVLRKGRARSPETPAT